MLTKQTKQTPTIPISRPALGEEEAEAAKRVIIEGWVTQGPVVAAFEQAFATCVGATYACAVSSCTAALHMALRAVGTRHGDEIITVSHTFIATANSILYCGANPVFVDIEPDTFNINPKAIERVMTPRTRAILCVHQMGMPCNTAEILAIARKHGIPVIEDAACAIGSEAKVNAEWKRVGQPHGDIACFSFHPRKVVTTGEGGMLTTNNPDWDILFRLWRHHGMSVPDTARHASKEVIFESYPELGFNYRMTDIQAAIGQVQLERLGDLIERRRFLAAGYTQRLEDSDGIVPPTEPPYARSNWQSYCVRLPDPCGQKEVMQAMLDSGVATRRGIMCIHREESYASAPQAQSLTESERAQDHCILLPLYHELTEAQQDYVVDVLKRVCRLT